MATADTPEEEEAPRTSESILIHLIIDSLLLGVGAEVPAIATRLAGQVAILLGLSPISALVTPEEVVAPPVMAVCTVMIMIIQMRRPCFVPPRTEAPSVWEATRACATMVLAPTPTVAAVEEVTTGVEVHGVREEVEARVTQ